jgi:integrase/recombinase XerD
MLLRTSKVTKAQSRQSISIMSAIRMLFFWLTEKGVLAMNPAREVKTERFSRTEGKTPAFVDGEVQKLLDAIETSTHTGLSDRALLGTLAYTFARIGAVVNLKVEDYYPSGKWFLLRNEMPAHRQIEETIDEYLSKVSIGDNQPLLQSVNKTGNALSGRALNRHNAWAAIRKRARNAGFLTRVGCHTWRATGVTVYLENGGRLEHAQQMAAHESPRTTKLYDRTKDEITIGEVERIQL